MVVVVQVSFVHYMPLSNLSSALLCIVQTILNMSLRQPVWMEDMAYELVALLGVERVCLLELTGDTTSRCTMDALFHFEPPTSQRIGNVWESMLGPDFLCLSHSVYLLFRSVYIK
jgi:hypothetical protein